MKIFLILFGGLAVLAVVFVFWGFVIEYLGGESNEERIALERMRLDREEDEERQKRGR